MGQFFAIRSNIEMMIDMELRRRCLQNTNAFFIRICKPNVDCWNQSIQLGHEHKTILNIKQQPKNWMTNVGDKNRKQIIIFHINLVLFNCFSLFQ